MVQKRSDSRIEEGKREKCFVGRGEKSSMGYLPKDEKGTDKLLDREQERLWLLLKKY